MDLTKYFHFQGIKLVKIHDQDMAATVAMINHAYSYQDEAKGQSRTNIEHLTQRASETEFYVAKSNNEIAGCVYLEPKASLLHFGLLTVGDHWRGKGLAPAMMRAIEEYARKNHFKSLDLDYMSLAPWLKRYYEKFGFAETGEVTKWGTIDLVHMSKRL